MTSGPRINLIVLRVEETRASVAFYELLTGSRFQEEQHGSGPVHWSATIGDVLVEIYPIGEATPGSFRIGFGVSNPDAIVDKVRVNGGQVVVEPKDSPWGRRAVVADPDGNRVELIGSD